MNTTTPDRPRPSHGPRRLRAAACCTLALLACRAPVFGQAPQAVPAPLSPEPAAVAIDELLRTNDPHPPDVEKPDAIKNMDVIEKLGHKVPLDLKFINSDGGEVALSRFFDGTRPVLLVLVYYRCPMQCSTILQKLSSRLNALDWSVGDKFNVVVASFDPTELPEVAARARLLAEAGYVRGLPEGQEHSWAFLTASPKSARAIADAVGFPYRFLPESGEYSHPAVEFVLTPDGKVSRYLYGIDYPAERLRFALLEATEGKIGGTVGRILHFCFRFDPHANQYVVQAFRVMQVAAAATVAALSLFFAAMWGIERRRKRGAAGVPVGVGPLARAAAGLGR